MTAPTHRAPGSRSRALLRAASLAACTLLWNGPAGAGDGGLVAGPTYYEKLVAESSLSDLESLSAGLPSALHIDDSTATLEYRSSLRADGNLEWKALLSGYQRKHERVDAVYDIVLVLPLPAVAGKPTFTALDRGITAQEGGASASVPLIYGGEKISLKRNVSLEKTLLPNLLGESAQGRLPSLDGTGYAYTLWDAIVKYDPAHGDTLQGLASFRYVTDASVEAPDAADERLKAYLITWIPSLSSDVLPFAVRIDVRNPGTP